VLRGRGPGARGPPRRARGPGSPSLLLPRDPIDDKDVIVEIKAGEGGEESALFAGDLLRMYLRYAERHGWRTEILDAVESDLGGYKDVSVAVKGRSAQPARACGRG
jgi:peptide chain release factor 1